MTIASFRVSGLESLAKAIELLRQIPLDAPFQIEVQRIEKIRNARSNREMWAILNQIADQVFIGDGKARRRFPAAAWKEFYRQKLIEPRDVRMPNGEVVFDRPRTSELSQREFDEFLWRVKADAGDRGVTLESRDNYTEG